ncbi:TetR/AcrR family transcriptional regulator [Arthrobacter sp. zg-Y1219]|uniref:TetR/AcrR family transcriptional regulator n=1 Tax=Arthrobacter sp. zg-Y1219 TaxID=3049067 RepID=UPI0024C4114C|nr:TetR/AcrR family transcriptional regulator [Arthrobacter sp. zg-Y1219]MDK1360719.1 TetR/AcrR family transcriptional regulator [Arthrobacter sp. zg-Y1219]
MLTSNPADRRTALKSRHRQAIVDAAATLMSERAGTDFTVDELAARADVSRRTVFNHFASVDDVVTEACGNVLSSVVESLAAVPAGDGPEASMMEEMAAAFRSADLVGPMSYLTRVLGCPDQDPSPHQALMTLRVFTDVSDRLLDAMLRRRPDADKLALHLLVGSLAGGIGVLYHHWAAETGAVDTPESRQIWARHLERLIEAVRDGHGTEPSARAPA